MGPTRLDVRDSFPHSFHGIAEVGSVKRLFLSLCEMKFQYPDAVAQHFVARGVPAFADHTGNGALELVAEIDCGVHVHDGKIALQRYRRKRGAARALCYGTTMSTDPFALFDAWFAEARLTELNDSNAMALATVDAAGRPAVRMVLLKGHGPDGFVFYTNEQSRKADDLAANPDAALLFHWKSLRRQVRIEGAVSRVAPEESDAYFASRSRDSQLGAWASEQSRPLPDRATFETRYAEMRARFERGPVPRPPHWGGYRVTPERIEFWQDREHRLHERRLFTRTADGWDEGLLYP